MRILTFCALASLLVLAACGQNAPAGNTKATEANQEMAAPDPDTKVSAVTYHHLKGTIGKLPVVMDLVQRNPATAGEETSREFSGTYYYERKGQPLALYGNTLPDGQVRLSEYVAGEETGVFTGVLKDGRYEGTWESPKTKKKLPVLLVQDADAVAFKGMEYSSEISMADTSVDGKRISSTALYSELWLQPATGDAELDGFLAKEISAGMAGDSLTRLYSTPEALFKAGKTAFFDNYLADMKEQMSFYKEQPADSDEAEFTLPGYEQSTGADVMYNANGVLTIGYNYYAYAGGAHGNYGTTLHSYDLKNKKRYTLADVFQPGYEAALLKEVEKGIREYFDAPASAPLSDLLFESELTLTDNFGLTRDGIIFMYQPYEIAAYAAGAPVAFVPFKSLAAVLRPGFTR